MNRRWTIGKKLLLGVGALAAMLLTLAFAELVSLGNLTELLNTAVNKTARKQEIVGQIETAVEHLRTAQRGVVLYAVLKNPTVVQKSKDLFSTSTNAVETAITEIRPMLVTEEGRVAVDTILTRTQAWQPLYEEIVRMSAAGELDDRFNDTVNKTLANYEPILKSTAKLHDLLRGIQQAEVREAALTSSRARWLTYCLIGLCLCVAAGVLWMVRQIDGGLRQIAAEMGDGASQVASAASQISASSQSLAQGASEQAATLEETSAASEQIRSMTEKNAENSRVAAEGMTRASASIDEANRNLEQMVAAMNEINASSDKISKIIKVIDEIAFQTNILALNAAVEAARAGEAGMGFAVVADEVRSLAQRCAQAARDTADLIEESVARSSDGKTKLALVASTIQSITDTSNQVKTLVEEVSAGSKEQQCGIDQVSQAITQMQAVTQKTAASAEQGASASEELSGQSATLRSVIQRLIDMVDSGTSLEQELASH